VKKLIYKTLVRTSDKLRIEKIMKLVAKINDMVDPDHKGTVEDMMEECFKFLEQVPELVASIARMEKEYKVTYEAAEMSVTLMQKKGRENRKFKYSEQNAQKYFKFLDKFSHLKTHELNDTAMIALRSRAREMTDFEGRIVHKKGHRSS